MTKTRLKNITIKSLIVIVGIAACLFAWSNWPIKSNTNQPDPAVTLANKIGSANIKYSEGYVGETGSRIHYISAGEGEPIVFLHGFPSYWFTMFGLMEEFKTQFRVIAIDGLGVGKSDSPASVEAYKLKKLVAHLDGVINELDLDKVHIVGHDWGAAMATAYAQVHPDKVTTLTTMSALPLNTILGRLQDDASHQETFSYVSQFTRANPVLIKALGIKDDIWNGIYKPFLDKGLLSAEQGERIRADVGKPRRLNRFINWYRANIPKYDEIDDDDYWPTRDTRITVPALFIYGDQDRVVTPELVKDLQDASDNLRVLKLEGIEHRPHFDKPDVVVKNILRLIREQPR